MSGVEVVALLVGLVVVTLPVWLSRGGREGWVRTHGQPPHEEARYRYVKTSIPRVRRK